MDTIAIALLEFANSEGPDVVPGIKEKAQQIRRAFCSVQRNCTPAVPRLRQPRSAWEPF